MRDDCYPGQIVSAPFETFTLGEAKDPTPEWERLVSKAENSKAASSKETKATVIDSKVERESNVCEVFSTVFIFLRRV